MKIYECEACKTIIRNVDDIVETEIIDEEIHLCWPCYKYANKNTDKILEKIKNKTLHKK